MTTKKEKRDLLKLKRRVKKGEIVPKTNKSYKLVIMEKSKYLQMELLDESAVKKIDRREVKRVQNRTNNHTRILMKILNTGESHIHLQ